MGTLIFSTPTSQPHPSPEDLKALREVISGALEAHEPLPGHPDIVAIQGNIAEKIGETQARELVEKEVKALQEQRKRDEAKALSEQGEGLGAISNFWEKVDRVRRENPDLDHRTIRENEHYRQAYGELVAVIGEAAAREVEEKCLDARYRESRPAKGQK